MKKIIALAVASAFVAPVMAAEVTLSGYVGYVYSSTDAVEDSIKHDDNNIKVTATQELDNGLSVKATVSLLEDQSDTTDIGTDGTNLVVAGPFGSLGFGDNSSALDSTGDYTDVAPYNGGFRGDGADAAVLYTLPTFAPGLKVAFSMSPEGTNDVGKDTGVVNDEQGVALTYSNSGFTAYVAQSDIADASYTGYGAKYSASGIMVAYERTSGDGLTTDKDKVFGHTNAVAGAEVAATGIAITYKTGAFTFGAESQEVKEEAQAAKVDETVFFAKYNVGGGLGVFVEQLSDNVKTSPDDATSVGVTFSF